MYRLVTLPSADSIDLIRKGDVVAMCLMGANADNRAWIQAVRTDSYSIDPVYGSPYFSCIFAISFV